MIIISDYNQLVCVFSRAHTWPVCADANYVNNNNKCLHVSHTCVCIVYDYRLIGRTHARAYARTAQLRAYKVNEGVERESRDERVERARVFIVNLKNWLTCT